MGRNKMRKGGAKRPRNDEWTTDARTTTDLSNAALEKFYRGKIVPEEEWSTFLASMQSPLPTAMRVNRSLEEFDSVRDFLHKELSQQFDVKELRYFPQRGAMQAAASRGSLKRNAEHKRLKQILSALNEGGYITRQEAVSMIPPLLLNVQAGDKVLDMCSAPGSKTSQMLEALVGDSKAGCLVANDLNSSRLDVLTHQTNRCPGAHSHLVITNYDAMNYPLFQKVEDKFDRVLCDVMCSGDGTLRKSIDLWPRWNTVQGAELHTSQMKVLTRGMMLCKKGGIVVYSTCSLNPVEDEAVLSECLKRSQGTFRLIDPSSFVPGLIGSPGVTSWSLTSRDLTAELSTFEEAEAHRNGVHNGKGFSYRPTMFANAETLKDQNMHFAIRVFPHAQDTGGFFIAALECVEDYPNSVKPLDHPPSKPLHQIPTHIAETVRDALDLPATFPFSNIFYRNEHAREQKFYYACDAVAASLPTIHANIAQVGCKVFESFSKHSNDKLRFTTEGLGSLAPLLPSNFFVTVSPQLLLDLSSVGMSSECFEQRAGCSLSQLPKHSFVLRAKLGNGLGELLVAAEKVTATLVAAKVLPWQQTLCKLELNIPLVEASAEKSESDEEENAEPNAEPKE